MKTIVLLLLVSAYARSDEGDFAKHKAEMLGHIDEKIQKLGEHKTCVNAAANGEALHKCHDSMKEWRKAEHKEMMGNKTERMQKRMDKMKEKMGKMNEKTE